MAIKNILNIIANNGGSPSKKEPDPTPDTPIKPLTLNQKAFGDAVARKALQNVQQDKPYELAESAVKKGIDPSLTCIGGACNIYKDFGVDFSMFGGEAEGVRESRTGGKVVEYNPTFEKNYAKAGFEKLKGRPLTTDEIADLAKNKQLAPGMLIQYYNDKGIPEHTNIVLKSNEDGTYQVYNAFKHSTAKIRGDKSGYVYTLNPYAESYKNKKFNVFVMNDENAAKLFKNSYDFGKQQYKPGGVADMAFDAAIDEELNYKINNSIKEIKEMSDDNVNAIFEKPKKALTREDIIRYTFEEMLDNYQALSDINNYGPGKRFQSFSPEQAENFSKRAKVKYNRMRGGYYGIDYEQVMRQNLQK